MISHSMYYYLSSHGADVSFHHRLKVLNEIWRLLMCLHGGVVLIITLSQLDSSHEKPQTLQQACNNELWMLCEQALFKPTAGSFSILVARRLKLKLKRSQTFSWYNGTAIEYNFCINNGLNHMCDMNGVAQTNCSSSSLVLPLLAHCFWLSVISIVSSCSRQMFPEQKVPLYATCSSSNSNLDLLFWFVYVRVFSISLFSHCFAYALVRSKHTQKNIKKTNTVTPSGVVKCNATILFTSRCGRWLKSISSRFDMPGLLQISTSDVSVVYVGHTFSRWTETRLEVNADDAASSWCHNLIQNQLLTE